MRCGHPSMKDLKQYAARRRLAETLWDGFYRCPNTGKILEQLPGDDKVLCSCSVSNPRVPEERTEQTGVHIVRFLRQATVDEYLDQYFTQEE